MPVAWRKELQFVVCFRWACSVVMSSRVLLLAGRRMRVSSRGWGRCSGGVFFPNVVSGFDLDVDQVKVPSDERHGDGF